MELEIVPQLKGNNYKVTLLDMLNTPSMHHVESHLYLVTLAVSSPSKSWGLVTECAGMVAGDGWCLDAERLLLWSGHAD